MEASLWRGDSDPDETSPYVIASSQSHMPVHHVSGSDGGLRPPSRRSAQGAPVSDSGRCTRTNHPHWTLLQQRGAITHHNHSFAENAVEYHGERD